MSSCPVCSRRAASKRGPNSGGMAELVDNRTRRGGPTDYSRSPAGSSRGERFSLWPGLLGHTILDPIILSGIESAALNLRPTKVILTSTPEPRTILILHALPIASGRTATASAREPHSFLIVLPLAIKTTITITTTAQLTKPSLP